MHTLRRALPAAAASVCAALGSSVCAALDADTEKTARPAASRPAQWAHPSPYDVDVPAARFSDVSDLWRTRLEWDLPELMARWQAAGSAESWPWVWCQRNPTGPHHVFVGVGVGTLDQIRAVAAASPANNITIVLSDSGDLSRAGVSEAQLHALGCAVIYEPIAQIDVASKLLMLRDERIIAFDCAYLG
jgi:hypothetical protein